MLFLNFLFLSIFSFFFSACANTDDSLTLINNAVQTAVTCDALGMLVCDWTLPGHVNPLCMSIPAFLAAAGLSWKADTDMVSSENKLACDV